MKKFYDMDKVMKRLVATFIFISILTCCSTSDVKLNKQCTSGEKENAECDYCGYFMAAEFSRRGKSYVLQHSNEHRRMCPINNNIGNIDISISRKKTVESQNYINYKIDQSDTRWRAVSHIESRRSGLLRSNLHLLSPFWITDEATSRRNSYMFRHQNPDMWYSTNRSEIDFRYAMYNDNIMLWEDIIVVLQREYTDRVNNETQERGNYRLEYEISEGDSPAQAIVRRHYFGPSSSYSNSNYEQEAVEEVEEKDVIQIEEWKPRKLIV